MIDAQNSTSTRPYLIRALYEWCTDNGFTPYVAVQVDDSVRVPREHVKDGEIVLNISFEATSSLKLGPDFIEFTARFSGTAREIMVPMDRVIAIYARENGQGMAFPMASSASDDAGNKAALVGRRDPSKAEPEVKLGKPAKPVKSVASVKSVESAKTKTDAGDSWSGPPKPGPGRRPRLTRVK